MMRTAVILGVSLLLSACSYEPPTPSQSPTTSLPPDAIANDPSAGDQCDAAGASQFVGQEVSLEIGLAIQKDTGSEIFEWVLQGQPVTSDFRLNRVRVTYDEAGTIIAVNCG